MKTAVLIVLFVILVLHAIVIYYDCFVFLYERYSHFHMGRWSSATQWQKRVERVCRKWVVKTPTLRIKKECRYILIDQIRGVHGKKMVQSWQKAGCLLGVEETKLGKAYFEKVKKQLLTEAGEWKRPVDKIDYAMMAYALLKVEPNPDSIQPAMDQILDCLRNNLCSDGMVSYSEGRLSIRRYVDTLGFICPFLGVYGKVYSDPTKIDFAFDQIKKYREIGGVYKGLPYHCMRFDQQLPLSVLGWGRGVGWYSTALVDLYPSIVSPEQKKLLNEWILELAQALGPYEREGGGYSSILQANNPYDSSATAMLGYFYARAFQIFGEENYRETAIRCCKILMKKTKITGAVDECHGDTIDIGIISEKYGEAPYAQGITLRLAETLNFSQLS